jgi:hypothetical protein
MDRRAIRTDDQRLERIRLIQLNRQKRAEKKNEDEKALDNFDKQLSVFFL